MKEKQVIAEEIKPRKTILVIVNDGVGNASYLAYLRERFDVQTLEYSKCTGKEKPDLVLFTGGEDVTPKYYNQPAGKYTSYNQNRDDIEFNMFKTYFKYPKLGICRGSQFLTVATGGSLVQHVEGHAIRGTHTIQTENEVIYPITSTHHQMLFPFHLNKDKYRIIAHSEFHLSTIYWNGKNENLKLPDNFVETEIVYYYDTKALCIQGHPEMGNCPTETKTYCLNLIEKFLTNE